MASEKRKAQIRAAKGKLKYVRRWVVDPKTGERKQRDFYGATKELAERAYEAFLNPVPIATVSDVSAEALARIAPKGSFVEVFASQVLPLKRKRAESTLADLQETARHLLQTVVPGFERYRAFAFIPVAEITSTVIALALDVVEERRTLRNPNAKDRKRNPEIWKQVSPRLVNKCRTLAIETMRVAHEVDQRNVPWVNADRIPKRDETPAPVAVFTPGELRRLLEASRGHVGFVTVILEGFLGMRTREAHGVAAEALADDDVLDVSEQQRKSDHRATTTKLKTKNAYRSFPLPEAIAAELRPFAATKGERLARGQDKVVVGKETWGKPLSPHMAQAAVDRALRRAGLPRLTHHKLRHTFSSFLDDASCPSAVRIQLMGHSRTRPEDRYNHAWQSRMREWIGRLWDAGEEEYRAYLAEREAAGEPAFVALPKGGAPKGKPGSSNPRAVLNEGKVAEIRALLKPEDGKAPATIADLSRRYGVARRTITKIRDGESWAERG